MDERKRLSRERQKAQLRKSLIQSAETEEERLLAEKMQRKRKVIRIVVIAVVALICAGVFIYKIITANKVYDKYSVVWEQELGEASHVSASDFYAFADGVLQMNKDGATYFDATGNRIWSVPYEMKTPRAVMEGEYVLIYDVSGNAIVICSKGGKEGTALTSLPITKGDISASGTAALVLEDSTSSYIAYYRKDGERLDVEMKFPLETWGYPYDISIAPNSQQLVAVFSYIEGGSINSKVIFFDFEYGKEVPNRIVAAYTDYYETNTFIPDVEYIDNVHAMAIGDNQLSFFSAKNRQNITREQVGITGEIKSRIQGNDYVSLFIQREEELHIQSYSYGGGLKSDELLDLLYMEAFYNHDFLTLYDESHIRIQEVSGKVRYDQELGSETTCVLGSGISREYYVVTGNILKKIRIK